MNQLDSFSLELFLQNQFVLYLYSSFDDFFTEIQKNKMQKRTPSWS